MGFIPPNPHCICSTHRVNQALDDNGYIYIATKHSVQIVDTETGKLVRDFGSYGNEDCKGKGARILIPSYHWEAFPVWRYGKTSFLSWTFSTADSSNAISPTIQTLRTTIKFSTANRHPPCWRFLR